MSQREKRGRKETLIFSSNTKLCKIKRVLHRLIYRSSWLEAEYMDVSKGEEGVEKIHCFFLQILNYVQLKGYYTD